MNDLVLRPQDVFPRSRVHMSIFTLESSGSRRLDAGPGLEWHRCSLDPDLTISNVILGKLNLLSYLDSTACARSFLPGPDKDLV